MSKFKSVVFDIDGTLTHDISWVYLTKQVGGSIEYNDSVFDMWRKSIVPESEIKKRLIANWSVGGKTSSKEFFTILDAISLREDAKETVEYLKSKNYDICLLTGSFDLYAKIIAEKLGVSKWLSITKFIWDENGKLIDIDTALNDKQQKIEIFKNYCKENNFKYEECVAVGDSSNDIGLFELTKNGIAVRTPAEALELEKVAWKKIENLRDLKNIL